jgi:hypothetical protein
VSRLPVGLVFAWCASLAGCGQIDHARQCKTLARFVNQRLDAIDVMSHSGTNRQSYAKVAVQYDALERDLTGLPISDAKLKPEIPEMAKAFSRAAGAARRAAHAVERHDDAALEGVQREFERVDQRHKALVRKLDGACR